jgi:hypothetical protein
MVIVLVASTSRTPTPTTSPSSIEKKRKGKTGEETATVRKKIKSRVNTERPSAALPAHSARPPPEAAESGPIPSVLVLPSPRRCSWFPVMGLLVAAEQLLRRGALDWEQEAYPSYDDFLALPVFVLFFPTVRFFLDRFVFEVRLEEKKI